MSSAVAGYKSTLGADAPPCSYEDVDHADLRLHRRLEHGGRSPGVLPPARSCARATQGHARGRRRPASHRHRARGGPAPRDRAGHRRRALPRDAAPAALGRALRPGIHPRAHRGLPRAARNRPRVHAVHRRRDLRDCRARPRAGCAVVRRGGRGALALLPGAEPVDLGHAQERGADQPASRHRPDRAARCGAVQPHRAAECDGRPRGRRAREPAPRAPRGRRPRGPRADRGALGRRGAARSPRQDGGRDVRSAAQRPDQGGLDRLHEPRAVAAGPAHGARGARARRAGRRAGRLRRHRDGALRRRRSARGELGREGRYGHQLRAAHLARARRGAAPGRGTGGLGDRRRFRAPARATPAAGAARSLRVRIRRGGVERASRGHPRPRSRHHRALVRDPRRRSAAVADARRRIGRPRAPVRGWRVSDRIRQGALLRVGVPATGRARRRALLDPSDDRTAARPMARHEPHRHRRPGVQPFARARGRDAPRRSRAPRPEARRPRHRRVAARPLDRAGRGERRCRERAGVPRHALGRPVPRRRGGRRRECAHHRGIRSRLQAAGAEARGRPRRESRPALAPRGVRVAGIRHRECGGRPARGPRRGVRVRVGHA